MSLIFPKDTNIGLDTEDISKPIEKLCRLMESCYGPCGGDRLVQKADGSVVITNDGATFLSHLNIVNPVAKMIVESSCRQDENAGDGTTGVVLLSCYLVLNGLKATKMGLSVPKIIGAYEICQKICHEVMVSHLSSKILPSNDVHIENIISTSLSSKIIAPYTRLFQELLVTAYKGVTSFRSLQFHRLTIPNGAISDTEVVLGLVFEDVFSYSGAFFPKDKMETPKILFLNSELEVKHQGLSSRVQIDDVSKYHEFASAEWSVIYETLDYIIESDFNIVISLKAIGDMATQFLSKNNIVVIGRVPKAVFDSLILFTEGLSQSSALSEYRVGTCKSYMVFVENEKRYHSFYSDERFPIYTFITRAPSELIADEVNRSVDDSIGILEKLKSAKDPVILYGGGCFELDLCHYMRHSMTSTRGVPSILSNLYADSLESLVSILLKNTGCAVSSSLALLKSERFKKWPSKMGVSSEGNGIGDMSIANVWELTTVRTKALKTATEIACLLISVDTIILYPLDLSEDEKAEEYERKIREKNLHGRRMKEKQLATRGDIH